MADETKKFAIISSKTIEGTITGNINGCVLVGLNKVSPDGINDCVLVGLNKKSPDGINMIQHKSKWYCSHCTGCAKCTIYCGVMALKYFCLRGPTLLLTSNNPITIQDAIDIICSTELQDQETMCINDNKWSIHTKTHHFELEHQLSFTPDQIRSQLKLTNLDHSS